MADIAERMKSLRGVAVDANNNNNNNQHPP